MLMFAEIAFDEIALAREKHNLRAIFTAPKLVMKIASKLARSNRKIVAAIGVVGGVESVT